MDIKEYTKNIRRKIHQNPEIGFEVFETQKLIIYELEKMNVKYSVMPEKTGVIADIGDINETENIIMFRADMDALPVLEESSKKYCSKNKGKMHACGHDAHVAIMLGVLKALSDKQDQIKGRLRVLFQPNEEGGGGISGANFMIENKALKPKPKAIFGVHVKPDLETGVFGFKYGAIMAAVDAIKIKLIGTGGHAAMPKNTPDVILASSKIIQKLYEIIPNNEPEILTLGQISAGSAFNIMPKELKILGTARTLDADTRYKIRDKITEIVKEYAESFGINVEISIDSMSSPLINNDKLVDHLIKIAKDKGYKFKILEKPCMGGEDFADYLKYIEGSYFYLGTGNKAKDTVYDWHNPKFDIDEDALEVGVNFFLEVVQSFLYTN